KQFVSHRSRCSRRLLLSGADIHAKGPCVRAERIIRLRVGVVRPHDLQPGPQASGRSHIPHASKNLFHMLAPAGGEGKKKLEKFMRRNNPRSDREQKEVRSDFRVSELAQARTQLRPSFLAWKSFSSAWRISSCGV